jgi:ketosteroid isomerase-like protein
MSEESVENLREAYAAFSSGDISRILEFADSDFEAIVPPELSAEPDTYRGHDGIRRYFESFEDAMDDIRFEPERFWDAGQSVVALVRITAKGRQTAILVEQQIAQVWTVLDGRAVRLESYPSLSEALEAAGVEE